MCELKPLRKLNASKKTFKSLNGEEGDKKGWQFILMTFFLLSLSLSVSVSYFRVRKSREILGEECGGAFALVVATNGVNEYATVTKGP